MIDPDGTEGKGLSTRYHLEGGGGGGGGEDKEIVLEEGCGVRIGKSKKRELTEEEKDDWAPGCSELVFRN